MSTGKRLAKRSIIGTRVCAPGNDGKYYSGVIHAVKTPASATSESGLRITPKTRYSVRFDSVPNGGRPPSPSTEYSDRDLIGPGFGSVTGARLVPGQKVYLTYNGREINAEVTQHREHLDEVDVLIAPNGQEGTMRLTKRIDEVRLLESRKSARLADQDTDFARLADMAGDRKRASSHSIDVPHVPGSRKRRPSSCNDSYNGWPMENGTRVGHGCGREGCRTNERGDCMDECTAALVLMSLSCSPHSPHHSLPLHCQLSNGHGGDNNAMAGSPGNGVSSNSSSSSSNGSWRSGTPSPPLSEEGVPVAASTWPTSTVSNGNAGLGVITSHASPSHNQLKVFSGLTCGNRFNSPGNSDEGIDVRDVDDINRKKKKRELTYPVKQNRRHLVENGAGFRFKKISTIPNTSTMVFKCTWPGCTEIKTTCPLIEAHVRQSHLGPKKAKAHEDDDDCDMSDHEEEFYYQEVAVNHMSSPPTMSHRDMARPPHEDPEYQKQLQLASFPPVSVQSTPTLATTTVANSMTKDRLFNFKVSTRPRSPKQLKCPEKVRKDQNFFKNYRMATPMKHLKHSSRHLNHHNISMLAITTALGKITSTTSPRRVRGDTKKCRKIYGMENREQWCTQCKWKKACVRFSE